MGRFARGRSPLTLLVVGSLLLAACTPGASLSPTPSASPTSSATPCPSVTPEPTATEAPTATPTPCPTPTATVAPTATPRPSPTPVPSVIVHVVVPGDTLTALARAYRTTAFSIAWWNHVAYPTLDPESAAYAPDRIDVGWQLTIRPGRVVDPQDLPAPSITPLPSVTIGPVPTPTGAASALLSHGSRTSNAVALTFDMGGRTGDAVAIVEWLVAHRVQATIFPTGEMGSTTTAGRTILALIAAHPELFTLGNHSWDHPDFTKLTASQIASQLTRTEAAIAPLAGRTTKPYFRPPYGAQNSAVRAAVGAAGWRWTVLWDVDPIDWRSTSDGGPTADDLVAIVAANAQRGSIVLMHLGGWHTYAALPRIVDALRARGLEPVTLDRLLGR